MACNITKLTGLFTEARTYKTSSMGQETASFRQKPRVYKLVAKTFVHAFSNITTLAPTPSPKS